MLRIHRKAAGGRTAPGRTAADASVGRRALVGSTRDVPGDLPSGRRCPPAAGRPHRPPQSRLSPPVTTPCCVAAALACAGGPASRGASGPTRATMGGEHPTTPEDRHRGPITRECRARRSVGAHAVRRRHRDAARTRHAGGGHRSARSPRCAPFSTCLRARRRPRCPPRPPFCGRCGAVRSGAAHATARLLHVGRSFVAVLLEVTDDDGRRVAQVMATQAVLAAP